MVVRIIVNNVNTNRVERDIYCHGMSVWKPGTNLKSFLSAVANVKLGIVY